MLPPTEISTLQVAMGFLPLTRIALSTNTHQLVCAASAKADVNPREPMQPSQRESHTLRQQRRLSRQRLASQFLGDSFAQGFPILPNV